MSRSNRRSDIAFGGLVVLTLILVAVLYGMAEVTTPYLIDPDATDCPTSYDQRYTHRDSQSAADHKDTSATGSDEPKKRNSNYCVQWRTAVATERQAEYSLTSLDLIRLTLAASVVAAFAAGAAAVAAWRTVRTMQETGERQLRAYITIEDGAIFLNSPAAGNVAVFIRFKNGGATPCYKVRSWHLFSRRATQNLPFNETSAFESEGVHGPNSFFSQTSNMPITADELQAVREARESFFVWGRVEYLGAFGERRYFSFKTTMNGTVEAVKVGGDRGQGWGLKPIANGFDAD